MESHSEKEAMIALEVARSREAEISGEISKTTPLRDDCSPIDELTGNRMKRSSSVLSLSKSSDTKKACSHEDSKLDLRAFYNFEHAKECITKCGPSLTEVYYNVNCPVSLLGKFCENLENLIIDYKENQNFCVKRDVDLRLTWSPFENLLRVMLTNINTSSCDFLIHLPKTVIELQLTCIPPGLFHARKTRAIPINLSNLPNLRSLKLIGFLLNGNTLIGLKELKKLHHLHIEKCEISPKIQATLASCHTLEYLTIKDINHLDWILWNSVLSKSKNLKYLDLNEASIRLSLSSEALRHLKYLRMSNIPEESFEKIVNHGLPSLEYLDGQIIADMLCKIIEDSPNLKFINIRATYINEVTMRDINMIKEKQKTGVLKLFLGKNDQYKPTHYSSYFVVDQVPNQEELMLDVREGWFTKDSETIIRTPEVLPLNDDSSPIQTLPINDEWLLRKIFSYLSIDERLSVEEVCSYWRSILRTMWQMEKSFDIRKLRYPEDAEKYLERCSEKMETIYYYKDCDLSLISQYCSNVKTLTIDFQSRMYSADQGGRTVDVRDLQSTLLQLKNLTSLTLKNTDHQCNYDFLKDLPQTMAELHIFAKNIRTWARIDLGKFSQLHTLTLSNFNFSFHTEYTLIRGLEKLQNLKYLRLETIGIRGSFIHYLASLSKLEYLSVSLDSLIYDSISKKFVLRAISSKLKNLKLLCLTDCDFEGHDDDDTDADSNGDDDDNEDSRRESALQLLRNMESLEYFYYSSRKTIQPGDLEEMARTTQNFKLLAVESEKYNIEQIVDPANRVTWCCTDDEDILKVIVWDDDRIELITEHICTICSM